jgi:hypothetical protein
MLKETMPAPADDTVIIYCGPPLFKKEMAKNLTKLGHVAKKGFIPL